MKRNPLPLPSEVEVEAIETLLSLPNLIKKYELLSQYSFTWGIKKKRSVLVNRKVTSSSVVLDADKSPSTPLCFVNSDGGSDCFDKANKPLPSLSFKNILKKKLVDDLKVKLNGMQEENDKLKRDIASMVQKKQELQAQNLELKAKKHKISYTRNVEDMQLWNNPMKMNIDQHVQQRYHHQQQQISMFAPQQQQQQQQQQRQQYMVDPNTGKVMTMSCSSNIDSGGSRFGLFNQIKPRVQRETYDFMSKSQPLDHGKYMVIDNDLRARNCAAARKRRILRMKENKISLLNMRLSRGSR